MDNFHEQMDAIKVWTSQAEASGWISQPQLNELDAIEQQTADDLFLQGSQRPLVVALFGGTGAGKSSLLNRLAGEELAKTGVERPTSHEITLFLHQDYQLNALPTELPTEKINIRYHDDDSRKLIAWLDMPDIDSTETANRQLVTTWLPYIDWLVYVVTPERYQDDIGWRFLQHRGQRHHWLFVMNHWDEAVPEQLEDLRARLIQENFPNPSILRTSCVSPGIEDDFAQLEQTIQDALKKHGLAVLKRIGIQARINDLNQLVERLQHHLGTDEQWKQARQSWLKHSQEGLASIKNALTSQSEMIVQNVAAFENSGFRFWRKKKTAAQLPPPESLAGKLWSPRIDSLSADLMQTLKSSLQSQPLPYKPFIEKLSDWQASISTALRRRVISSLTESMAKPGGTARRFFWKATGWLSLFLPLAAAIWVVTHVVQRFYTGTQGLEEFLGGKFAIHSILMITLGWFVPWLLQRYLQPSQSLAVGQGLEEGIQTYTKDASKELEHIFQTQVMAKDRLNQSLGEITTGNPHTSLS